MLSLPLELRLNQDYRYELAGIERDRRARVLPRALRADRRTTRRCIEGTVWIDRRSFAKVRVQAVQTRTAAPIVSNEEIHTYEVVASVEGAPIFVLTRANGAADRADRRPQPAAREGRAFQRRSHQRRRLSPPRARRRGRASASCIATPTKGVRYLVKQGDTRVVSDRSTTHAKAMAIGVLVDPSFAFPLPIFGINYLNFEVARPQPIRSLRCCLAACSLPATCSGRRSAARRSTRASISSASPCRRAIACTSADGERPEERTLDLAALGRRQSRVAIHGVSEGRVSISTALRSVRARSHDG